MAKKGKKFIVATSIWRNPKGGRKDMTCPQLTRLQLFDRSMTKLMTKYVDTTMRRYSLSDLAKSVFGSQWEYQIVSEFEIGVQPTEFGWLHSVKEVIMD